MNGQIQAWTGSALDMIRSLFATPELTAEVWFALACGVLGFLIAMIVVGRAQGLAHMNWTRAVAALLVTAILVLAATVATWRYVVPAIQDPRVQKWVLGAVAVLTLLLIVLPVQTKLQRATYVQSLLNLLLSAAAAVGVVMLASQMLETAEHGKGEFGKIKSRTSAMDKVIKQ